MSSKSATKKPRMIVTRSIMSLPFRTAARTWRDIIAFFTAIVAARNFPTIDTLVEALADVEPLGVALVTRHALDGGTIIFETEDLQVTMTIAYGEEKGEENLAIPPVAAQRPLSASTKFKLTFSTCFAVQDEFFDHLFDRESGDDLLTVQLTTTDGSVAEKTDPSIKSKDLRQKGESHGSRNGHKGKRDG